MVIGRALCWATFPIVNANLLHDNLSAGMLNSDGGQPQLNSEAAGLFRQSSRCPSRQTRIPAGWLDRKQPSLGGLSSL